MSTEPYVPTMDEIRECVTSFDFAWEDAGFDRFINKIKADSLRGAAERIRAAIIDPSPSEAAYYHGARYGQRKVADWLDVRADRIEEEA